LEKGADTSEQLERGLDVRSSDGTRVYRADSAQDIAGARENLQRQSVFASVSVLLVMRYLIFSPTLNSRHRHHHVESIHLTTSRGHPLHPALAVVQTSSREYYILRDNGMEVGCEEEGVASVWMRILGCNARGEAVRQGGVSFGELNAYIQGL
jgi:hypothetical protein